MVDIDGIPADVDGIPVIQWLILSSSSVEEPAPLRRLPPKAEHTMVGQKNVLLLAYHASQAATVRTLTEALRKTSTLRFRLRACACLAQLCADMLSNRRDNLIQLPRAPSCKYDPGQPCVKPRAHRNNNSNSHNKSTRT